MQRRPRGPAAAVFTGPPLKVCEGHARLHIQGSPAAISGLQGVTFRLSGLANALTCLSQFPPLAVYAVTIPRHLWKPSAKGTEGHKCIWEPKRQWDSRSPFHKKQVIMSSSCRNKLTWPHFIWGKEMSASLFHAICSRLPAVNVFFFPKLVVLGQSEAGPVKIKLCLAVIY